VANSKPYYKRFPKAYLADTQHLELEDHGLYSLALDLLWLNNGKISTEKFRKSLKITPKKFEKKFKKISEFFEFSGKNGEFFEQKRLSLELSKYREKCEKNAESSKKGVEARQKNREKAQPNGKKNETALLNQKPETRNQKPETKKNPRKHSFRFSPYFDKKVFAESLPEWPKEKLAHYYRAADEYSQVNGGKYLNWILAVQIWARKDEENNKVPWRSVGGRIPTYEPPEVKDEDLATAEDVAGITKKVLMSKM
jgi:uncharacterized protein YdaU (DUF1376 family)